MCKILKVDKSSYYHWIKNGCVIKRVDEKLNELILMLFISSNQTYGTRRIKSVLMRKFGLIVSRRKVRDIMRYLNLSARVKRRFKINTTNSNHNLPIAPNIINRDFYAPIPHSKYVGDITYIPTNEGWLYLAVVIDLYSRRVIGWSMSDNMGARFFPKFTRKSVISE